jgi:hypothetical protein
VTDDKTNWTYVRRLFGAALVVLGAFLLAEHVYRFGFEFYDIIGHEYLGLALILGGVLMTMRWRPSREPDDV